MPFCTNCGNQFPDNSKFCPECGTPVAKAQPHSQSQRIQSFAGEIRKCPNCGEPLSAFEIKCQSCGYELRNVQGSKAVAELAAAIAALEATRPPQSKEPKTLYDLADTSAPPTDQSIANIIQSFVIPNSKEDILEFMILASANINTDALDSSSSAHGAKLIANAWVSKFEQSYQKAKLSFGNSPGFNDIQTVYDKRQKEIRRGKSKTNREILFIALGFVAFMILIMIFSRIMGNMPSSTKTSSTQASTTFSQEDSKKNVEEFKKDTKEFKETMEEYSEGVKNIVDGYKNFFSGIFD